MRGTHPLITVTYLKLGVTVIRGEGSKGNKKPANDMATYPLAALNFAKGFLHKQITRNFCHNIHAKSQEGSLT